MEPWCSLVWEPSWSSTNRPLPTRYHTQSCYVKGVGISWGNPKLRSARARPLGMHGEVPDRYKHALPHVGYHVYFDGWWSNGTSVGMEIRRIMGSSRPVFQSHSKSSDNTDRSGTYGFLLTYVTFHSNHGPILYRWQDKRHIGRKLRIFLNLRLFYAPAERVPIGVA